MAENENKQIKIEDIKTVEQMLEWKASKSKESVESKYTDITGDFGWSHTDVLYSFLGIYALGVYAYNKKNLFTVTDYMIKEEGTGYNIYNLKYLSRIQNDPQYDLKDLNNKIIKFISCWSELGNVFPIWPGGNKARGKANIGCFDIPELYFAKEYKWFLALRKIYKDTLFFDGYINRDTPRLKKYKSLESFLQTIDTQEKYDAFLKRICKTIDERTEKLEYEYVLRKQIELSMSK